nr:unnamed protein product [Callosobruchus chinensis]
MSWLKIDNLFKYNFISFIVRILSKSTPSYLREKQVFRNVIHNVNIHFCNNLTMPQHTRTSAAFQWVQRTSHTI